MKSRKRWLFISFLPILALLAFVLWAQTPLGPAPEALASMKAAATEDQHGLVFKPEGIQPTKGFIFYPGGRVDPRSYAPAAEAIAQQGYLVVIAPMPLNLAVLDADQAKEIITAFPEISTWAVGGHSLGGAMAARFASRNPDLVQGLVLWAGYPASSDKLSNLGLEVTSVYGSNDGLATPDKIEASRPLLPANTDWAEITGGNHAQFGWYGVQPGDNTAAISHQNQQDQAVAATLELLSKLK